MNDPMWLIFLVVAIGMVVGDALWKLEQRIRDDQDSQE